MKEYKLVYLNKGVKFSRDKDLETAEEVINPPVEQRLPGSNAPGFPERTLLEFIGVYWRKSREGT